MKRLIVLATILMFLTTSLAVASDKKPAGAVRVYRFDNLDIRGKLKTPALMYFLRRIRNKFRSSKIETPDFTQKTIESKNADFLK